MSNSNLIGYDSNQVPINGFLGDLAYQESSNASISKIQSPIIGSSSGLILQPNGGNVGLGTTNPTQKLQVVGNVLVSGIVTASNGTLISGVEIRSEGNTVGTSVTAINFTGTGISTVTSSAGISTINIVADISPVMMGMIF